MSTLLPEISSSIEVHSKSAPQLHCLISEPPQARPSKRVLSPMLVLSPHAIWGAYTSALRFLLQGCHSVTALLVLCYCFRTAYHHSCKRCHTTQCCGGSGWPLSALDSLCPFAACCHPDPQLHSKRQRMYPLFLYLFGALGIVFCCAIKTFCFWTEANRSEKKNKIKWMADQNTWRSLAQLRAALLMCE